MDEGVAQLFTLEMNGRKIIGTVGALQYEVIQYRLEHEYGANVLMKPLSMHKACWVEADEKSEEFKEFARLKQRSLPEINTINCFDGLMEALSSKILGDIDTKDIQVTGRNYADNTICCSIDVNITDKTEQKKELKPLERKSLAACFKSVGM
ncbi:hypothetical protein FQA39_LY18620 [Lamprigera yunnana]|nr:hypothetical protein FQA39_LY18620 [Lamprigera yunnana]